MTVSDEIQINKQDLLLLLEKRGSIEGVKSRTQLAADLLGLISVIAVCCQFYGNLLWFSVFLMIATIWAALTSISWIYSYKNRYSTEQLYRELLGIAVSEHHFNLMVIRDKSGRLLTRWDKRWDMWLLPYIKSISADVGSESDREERKRIEDHVSSMLELSEKTVDCHLALTKTERKQSKSDNIEKVYYHRYFVINSDDFPQTEEFEINGSKYKWWRIEDLELDPKTIESNAEIVAAIKNEL